MRHWEGDGKRRQNDQVRGMISTLKFHFYPKELCVCLAQHQLEIQGKYIFRGWGEQSSHYSNEKRIRSTVQHWAFACRPFTRAELSWTLLPPSLHLLLSLFLLPSPTHLCASTASQGQLVLLIFTLLHSFRFPETSMLCFFQNKYLLIFNPLIYASKAYL